MNENPECQIVHGAVQQRVAPDRLDRGDFGFQRGQAVEIIVFLQPTPPLPRARLTVGRLRRSGLIGLWQDRDDIGDSSVYARHLREQAQQRGDIHYDFAR
jgi:hypothetical protein